MSTDFDEPFKLNAERFKGTNSADLALILAELIETQRVVEGGSPGGESTLAASMTRDAEIANGMYWFEFLLFPDFVQRCAALLNLSTADFLTRCMDELDPGNWETLWWMRAYFRLWQSGNRRLNKTNAEFAEARKLVAAQMNDKKHARHRKASAAVPGMWANLKAEGRNKREAAELIGEQVNLSPVTVRKKLRNL